MKMLGKASLTLFANFFIDTEERLQRMKDSYQSMQGVDYNAIVVNVRGRYASQAQEYLSIDTRISFLGSIESIIGWFYDSTQLLQFVKTDYVLLWLEDHLCMSPKIINSVINEMAENNIDVLTHSFFQSGQMRERYAGIKHNDGELITWLDHTINNNDIIQQNAGGSYLLSYASILTRKLFETIIKDGGKEHRWNVMTPFDFEKAPADVHWLPLRRGVPLQELFAPIDDDHGVTGSSLIARGIYPERELRRSYAVKESPPENPLHIRLGKKLIHAFKLGHFAEKSLRFYSFLKLLPYTPPNYWVNYLVSAFYQSKKPILPWFNYRAIKYLNKNLNKINKIFEYGGGSSSLYFAAAGKEIHSVEHNISWFQEISHRLRDYPKATIKLVLPQVSSFNSYVWNPADPDKFQSSDFRGYSFETYIKSIEDYADLYFDLIIVDGRSRPSCIKASVKKLAPNGILIVDNSDREYYFTNTKKIFEKWRSKTFVGTVKGLGHLETTTFYFKPV